EASLNKPADPAQILGCDHFVLIFHTQCRAYIRSGLGLKFSPGVWFGEGAESVLLPCQFSGFIPEDPTVMWTRSDLDPKSVHLLREGGDDLRGQNQHYSGRTSVRSDALDSGDFSLTLRNPQLTDSSSYTCSISDGRQEKRLTDIQLQVKGQQQTPTPAVFTGQSQYCRQKSERKWIRCPLTIPEICCWVSHDALSFFFTPHVFIHHWLQRFIDVIDDVDYKNLSTWNLIVEASYS
uniref:Ig-like domain-containing protein n=1 Tax=Amphilophus citrinellus TaxID=61819 RepID=A0A3Q0R933_AMPCI